MDLFLAARVGDLDRVRYLVETRGHDVNIINEYDVSPLYNAALCGHTHVVKYLLEKGAVAEENTYMGERCFYAALNDDLRRLLKRAGKLTAAYRCPFLESLRLMYEGRERLWPDMEFSDSGNEEEEGMVLRCHRAILRCRSPFFRRQLLARCRAGPCTLRLSRGVDPQAFAAVVQYMYSGRLELPSRLLPDCIKVCAKLELTELREVLVERMEGPKQGRRGHHHGQMVVEPCREEVVVDFKELASEVLARFSEDADICIDCDGRYFCLHRVILAGRSPYFDTMLRSGFSESLITTRGGEAGGKGKKDNTEEQEEQRRGPLPTIRMHDLSPQAFAKVVEWLYSDAIEGGLQVPEVFEVLDAATRFLLDGLRTFCTSAIIGESDAVDPFFLFHISTLYQLPRLEQHCFWVFAQQLDEVVHSEEFKQLVEESARSIQNREETDSIPFLDDIRYQIARLHATQPSEASRKYDLVDDLLEKLSLSA